MYMENENTSFYGLGIAPGIFDALEKLNFTVPTPIQSKTIPQAIAGKDIIGIAQTGTGKTLAFAIPMIQRLANGKGRGLVLVPTRELAIQVEESFQKLAPLFKMKTAVLIGGVSMFGQNQALAHNPQIIVATPGRLNDHLERKTVNIKNVEVLVLDEADRMLDMGFLPQIERIIRLIPKERQTMLFSATMPFGIVDIARRYMQLPVRTEIAPSGTAAETVTQELFVVSKELKNKLLNELLKQYNGSVLLFTRTKRAAAKITSTLRQLGHKASEIHSDRTQSQRKEALDGFKSGKYRILAATDIAARGIDVTDIELVINYEIPDDPGSYVHRIGRTGRAGRKGHAITLATPDQGADVKNIEKIINASIPLASHPIYPSEKLSSTISAGSSWGGRKRGLKGARPGQPKVEVKDSDIYTGPGIKILYQSKH